LLFASRIVMGIADCGLIKGMRIGFGGVGLNVVVSFSEGAVAFVAGKLATAFVAGGTVFADRVAGAFQLGEEFLILIEEGLVGGELQIAKGAGDGIAEFSDSFRLALDLSFVGGGDFDPVVATGGEFVDLLVAAHDAGGEDFDLALELFFLGVLLDQDEAEVGDDGVFGGEEFFAFRDLAAQGAPTLIHVVVEVSEFAAQGVVCDGAVELLVDFLEGHKFRGWSRCRRRLWVGRTFGNRGRG
jgi:hypothetical protein